MSNQGINIAQTANSAATMSQFQHSQKQANQSAGGILRRISPISIMPQLFEINIIDAVFGNIAATSFFEIFGFEKAAVIQFLERPELGMFFTIQAFSNILYAGDIIFPNGQQEQSSSPLDIEHNKDYEGDTDSSSSSGAVPAAGNDYLFQHLSQMQDVSPSEIGNLLPSMPHKPSNELEDDFFGPGYSRGL